MMAFTIILRLHNYVALVLVSVRLRLIMAGRWVERPWSHRKLATLVIGVLALAFWGAVLAGALLVGRWALRRYQARRLERGEGALRLPPTDGEDEHGVLM
jgi:hypothetical protein